MNKTPTTLIIMDGFGLRRETAGNAIAAANTPRLDQFFQEYAHTELSRAHVSNSAMPIRSCPPPGWMSACLPGRWATARSATPISVQAV